MKNILSKINSSVRYVSENSEYVKINYERLNKIIDKLDISKITYWLDSNPYGLLDLSCEEIINFLLTFLIILFYSIFFQFFLLISYNSVPFSAELILSSSVISLTTLHGFPTAITLAGISLFTRLFAPITLPSPIVIPGRMVTSAPIQTLSPTVIGWASSSP